MQPTHASLSEAQARRQADLLRLIHRGLGLNHADSRVGRDAQRHRHRFFHHLGVRHHLVHQPQFGGFLGVPTAAGENEFLRFLDADQARQTLARAIMGRPVTGRGMVGTNANSGGCWIVLYGARDFPEATRVSLLSSIPILLISWRAGAQCRAARRDRAGSGAEYKRACGRTRARRAGAHGVGAVAKARFRN